MNYPRFQKIFIYALLLIVPLLIVFARLPISETLPAESSHLLVKPFKFLLWPVREVKKIISYRATWEEYQQFKHQLETLRSRLIGLEEIIRENKRLEELLDFKRTQIFSTVAAEVIGRNPDQWNESLLINKGSDEGIAVGMPVINALGVVGKIGRTAEHSSQVILISDPHFQVAAVVQSSRDNGLLSGSLTGLCRLNYITSMEHLSKGSAVVTSKMSSQFPEGLLLGEVIEFSERDSQVLDIVVRPSVNIGELEEVLVILNEQN